ncbi:MAG: hypothetical protein GXO47_11010 [Chlorobi bacterium]|nr:hypothetical protein [Chlorobiota bacterium]
MKINANKRSVYFVIALAAFFYIVFRLIKYENWGTSFGFIDKNRIWLLIIQLLLWGINLFFESLKWYMLIRPFSHTTSLGSSVKMVLSGFTTGSITPGKIGEPGGKILLLSTENRASGVLASVYGSFLTNVAILLIALSVLPIVISKDILRFQDKLNNYQLYYFAGGIFIVFVSFAALYFTFKYFKLKVKNTRWEVSEKFFMNLRPSRTIPLFLITLARVITFNIQLYLWFLIFGQQGTDIVLLIPVYFAVITLFPSFFLVDLGIRGSAAVFIFGMIITNIPVILSVIFFLWLLNVAVPSLLGSVFIINHSK